MKKILLLAFTIFSLNGAFAQSQRIVLVEEFTQASCPPCEASTPMLNATLNANIDKVVQLRYQTSWPGVDPMNADNPEEVQSRVDYYGVGGVPNLYLDGAEPVGPVFPELVTQSNIDAAYGTTAPVAMTVTHTLSDNLTSASVTVTIMNEGTEAFNIATNRLRVALVEEEISWDSPPGSTSITVFDAVLKTFVTGAAGMAIPEIAAGESWTNTWEDIALPSRIYDFKEIAVVAFIQNDANRRVSQSSHSSPLDLVGYPNMATMAVSPELGDFCNPLFTPSVDVFNNGDGDANAYTVSLVANGAVLETKTIEEPLVAGTSNTITFAEVSVPPGTSRFGYTIDRLTQGELSTTDNNSAIIAVGKAGGTVPAISRDFENEPADAFIEAQGLIVDIPFNTLNFSVVNQDLIGGNSPLGGFGESTNSISIYLWAWNTASFDANGYMIIADQYEVPADGIGLSFDYAYTSWQGSNDRLIVEVSNDCGETFSEVFNQSGTDLRTGAELNAGNTFWRPASSEWRNVTADLSSYAGETILLRYRVVSAYGDMIYLDNIELKVLTDLNELSANESLDVFPNPASNNVNVQLTTANASNVQLRVVDMLGRTMKNENLGTVSGTLNHSLDVSTLTNGSYLLIMNVDGKDVVKRLSIAH